MKGFGKQFAVIFICILVVMATASFESNGAGTDDFVKIGLRYGSQATNTAEISSATGFILGTASSSGFEETMPISAYTKLTATVEGGHIALRGDNGVLVSSDIGINGCVMPMDYEEDGVIEFESKRYRGGVIFSIDANKAITVINYLSMDDYLYGVIHKEMSQSNPIEALKAQAVAARSYAALNLGRHVASGFDLCSTSHCQVYEGLNAEYQSTTLAVDDTNGLRIWAQNEPVETYYHSNSGGHTQNSAEVWSTQASHLIGKVDPFTPEYPWSVTMHFTVMKQKLELNAYDIGEILSVRVDGRNSANAVSRLVIKGTKGEIVLEKERIRAVLGTTLIKSRHFNIGEEYLGGISTGLPAADIAIQSSTNVSKAGDRVYVLSAGGIAEEIPVIGLNLYNGLVTSPAKGTSVEPAGFDDSVVATGDKVVFTGVGNGHGVGMSQAGAIEMAKQGYKFDEILKFYFTGIEVR